jgi:NAD(P)-dependent dehydrogenase (short-subunit alcohol dehydrogenase family)
MRVLITGAAGGIGSATAGVFEREGHDVLRHDVRDDGRMDISGDLLTQDTLDAVRRLCEERDVDAVVAAHGLAGAGELATITTAQILRIMRVNTTSVVGLYDAVAPWLGERDGAFVAVSSQAGLVGEAQNAVYSASKFALVGWARALAKTGSAPRMRVVCPGMIETPLLVAAFEGMAADLGVTFEDVLARRLAAVPNRRLGRPEEIGRASLWLAELTTPACVVAAVTGGEILY